MLNIDKRTCLPSVWRKFLVFPLLAALLLFQIQGCSKSQKLKTIEPPKNRTLQSYATTAKKGMIASPNKEASEIGLEVLKKGGNAADAAIAVSFALSVLRPQSTGIGGGGFLLYYDKKNNKTNALDFREWAPQKATKEMYIRGDKGETTLSQDGALAVAVPRLVAGLGFVYENYASQKIPWKDLVEPAANLAEKGFKVYPHLAEAAQARREVLDRFTASKKLFLPKGKPIQEGDLLVQEDLARTLRIISDQGWKSFYSGEIGASVVKSVQEGGGIILMSDFENVEALELEPVKGSYNGYSILSMPPPSSGGVILVEILNILEQFDLNEKGSYDPQTIHITTEAMKRAFLDRAHYLGDPRFVKVPVKGLIAKEYAKTQAESILLGEAVPSLKLSPADFHLKESDSTTHFSIVDREGNAVSSTQTINTYFGSGLVTEKTGIVLNNEMDDFSIQPGLPNVYGLVGNETNAIAPGKIPLSSMSPTLVFDKDGGLNMIVGSPGGPKIITAILNTILNRIEYQADFLNAVAAKRYHHQWIPDTLQVEEGLLASSLSQKLMSMGHEIREIPPAGLVMLVAREKDYWVGVCDPRGIGVPYGY